VAVADELVLDAPSTAAALNARNADRLAGARQLAKENPVAVANIVRGWVSKEAA
jgi:flagellar M-ring protein FliF